MKLNKTKCQILYLGCNIPSHIYSPGDKRQESCPMENDLGVQVAGKLTVIQQCGLVAQRTNHTLGA